MWIYYILYEIFTMSTYSTKRWLMTDVCWRSKPLVQYRLLLDRWVFAVSTFKLSNSRDDWCVVGLPLDATWTHLTGERSHISFRQKARCKFISIPRPQDNHKSWLGRPPQKPNANVIVIRSLRLTALSQQRGATGPLNIFLCICHALHLHSVSNETGINK